MSAPSPADPTRASSLPFPRRWLVYIALKFIVLALVIFVALRLQGLV